jgi:hypothetical protein
MKKIGDKLVTLYYFSKADHLLENLEKKRLKVSLIDDLNDPFEVYGVYRKSKNFAARLAEFSNKFIAKYGVICMSENDWNPVMWGHYADRNCGVCYRFEVRASNIWKVKYSKELKRDKKLTKLAPMKILQGLISTKSSEWRYEREFRLVVRLTKCIKENNLYFEEFSNDLQLREVRLGKECKLDIRKVRDAVKLSYGQSDVIVSKAKLSSTSFRIIEDRSFRE